MVQLLPSAEASVTTVGQIIQLSVAPVFLLAGIGAFLNVCAGRLSRIVDRARNVEPKLLAARGAEHDRHLAEISRHLCPMTLAEELKKLERNAEIYITHLKPGEIEPTMLEIEESAGAHRPRMLQNNLVLEF